MQVKEGGSSAQGSAVQRAGKFISDRALTWREREMVVHFAGRQIPLLVPTRDDPRVIEIGAIVLAMIFRLALVHQALTAVQILAAVVVAVLLDIPLTYARRKVLVTPASALITGGIVALVLFTSETWPFALASVLAILSKHLIRTGDRHIFNPSTFGLAAVLLAFPHLVHAGTDKWEVSAALSPVLILGGGMAAKQAKTFGMVDWFMPAYIGLLLIDSLAPHGAAIFRSPGPILSSFKDTLFVAHHDFAIFAFYLLADPRTAPPSRTGRRIYAVLAGLLGMILAVPGLSRMVALLAALLLANLAAALVINKRYAHEEVVTVDSKVKQRPPMPIFIANTVMGLVRRGKGASVAEAIPDASHPGRPAEPVPSATPSVDVIVALPTAPSSVETVVLPALDQLAGAYLTVHGDTTTRYPLSPRGLTSVGRAADNTVCLPASGVSRYHARFSRVVGTILLTDLESSNGTFVNGIRVNGSTEVHDGDRIDFGRERGMALDLHLPSTR